VLKKIVLILIIAMIAACNADGNGAKYIGTWQRTDATDQKWEISRNHDDIYLIKSWSDKSKKKFVKEFTAKLDKETLYVNSGISLVPIEILEDGRLAYYGKTFTKLTGGGSEK
jgi:hypothetical protein